MRDLDLLATFLEIYRSGSLTAAADRRGLSQPAVTGRLARLEQHLGEPLFIRTRRGVRPTERADDLARRIGPSLDQLRQALGPDVAQGAPPRLGTVRLGGAAELMTARVVPALSPLTARGLRLRITLGLAAELLAELARGRLDLVVSAIRPSVRGVSGRAWVDEEFLLVGPPALARTIDAGRLAQDPVRALAHLPLVAYTEDLPIVRRYWHSVFQRRPPNEVAVVVSDLRAVLAAVVAGAGVSVVPRYLAEPTLGTGSIEVLHEPLVTPLNTLYLATRTGGLADPTLAAVHEHLVERSRTWPAL